MQEDANYIRKLKDSLKDWKNSAMRLNEDKKHLKNKMKEVKRVLDSAKKHYQDEKTNWAIEKALGILEEEIKE